MSNCCQLISFLYNFSSLVNLSDCVFQLVFSNNAMDDNSDDDNVVLPSNLRDYYSSWKKSAKTFLDVYIVSKKTEELLDACREFIIAERCANFDQKMESGYKILETICTVSKKKSTRKLSNVLNLPDLVIDKIFSSVEESYNIYFDLNGPEEIPWQFEDQAEEIAEVCYSIINKFYEFMLCIVSPWWRMNKLGFGVMRRETSTNHFSVKLRSLPFTI